MTAVKVSELEILDNGSRVGTAEQLNFIGATLTTSGSTQVNVDIPTISQPTGIGQVLVCVGTNTVGDLEMKPVYPITMPGAGWLINDEGLMLVQG